MHVLISGASIAGPVLAFWLHRAGHRVTIVERVADMRIGHGGQPVDLLGPAVEVVDRMGLLDQVHEAGVTTRTMTLVRPYGRSVTIDAAHLLAGVSDRHIEIMRGRLAALLFEATRRTADYRFGTEIAELRELSDGLEAILTDGTALTVDLVVGADGLHSGVRRLTFGEEAAYRHYLGGYLAVYTLPDVIGVDDTVLAYQSVDRIVTVYPTAIPGRIRAVFVMRSPELAYDYRDRPAQQRLLRELAGDMGWQVPALLDALDNTPDFYFDSITQIRLDTWSRGRTVLVGDAGYSPGSAIGGGTSLAAVGAYVLASHLAATPDDHTAAFVAYQRDMTDAVAASRRIGPAVLNTMVPHSGRQVWAMAQALRILPHLPGRLRRKLTSFGGSPAAMLDSVNLHDPVLLTPEPRQ